MTKIIFNADDFGFCRSVNYGILDAHLYGVLTSATLMVTMPGCHHAAELSKQHPSLKVGLHLNISLGKPITGGKSLVDETGHFMKPIKISEFNHQYNETDILTELEAQYQRFIEYMGHKPTHVDSHLFSTDKIIPMRNAAIRLAEKYDIPLRNYDINEKKHVEFITFRTFNESPGLEYLEEHFSKICEHQYVEIMSHPAYLENYILQKSSYHHKRCDELDILCSDWLRDLIDQYDAELISYDEV